VRESRILRNDAGDGLQVDARPKKPLTLVLLPGLDGTDVFFRPLLAALPPAVRPLVVCLPTSGSNTYGDLLATVRTAVAKLPACYVPGWSFSGPLALMLAVAEPTKVRGVILGATFVRPPHPVLARVRFAAITPVIWTRRASRRVPGWLWREPNNPVQRAMAETWARVGARVVAARVRAPLTVDASEPLRRCRPPVLYLASSHDEVVPPRNGAEIVRIRPSVQVRTIAGRHLALYTNPEAAAYTILEFLAQEESVSRGGP
jgi:pimeloyl-[acyl-carrier protein] methyl ester esterase